MVSLLMGIILSFTHQEKSDRINNFAITTRNSADSSEELRIVEKASMLRQYLTRNKFNTHYCFLVDMRLHSGTNRFFAFDLFKNSILLSGLVAHGHCKMDYCPEAIFSNQSGSCCSSLGRYRIGKSYQGSYGKSYKLTGLDSTNSQAFARSIVLHAYPCVPEMESAPGLICNSSGCPMVSPLFFKRLEPIVDHADRPIIMWIFD